MGGRLEDQAARRAAAIEQVRTLLAAQPLSCSDVATQLGMPSNTIYRYLCLMEEVGEVYRLEGHDGNGRKIWALDSEDHQAATDRAHAEHARRAWIVPARQVGMWRDSLDVALFGPARGGVA